MQIKQVDWSPPEDKSSSWLIPKSTEVNKTLFPNTHFEELLNFFWCILKWNTNTATVSLLMLTPHSSTGKKILLTWVISCFGSGPPPPLLFPSNNDVPPLKRKTYESPTVYLRSWLRMHQRDGAERNHYFSLPSELSKCKREKTWEKLVFPLFSLLTFVFGKN